MTSAPASAKAVDIGIDRRDHQVHVHHAAMCGRIAAQVAGPKVMLGTKWPSITSTCTQSAPCVSIASHSAPKSAKSAARIDGRDLDLAVE
jgi:hypothetical protein